MRRTAASSVLAAALALALTACASPDVAGSRSREKEGADTVRSDLEPIARRYPVLAHAESIAWSGGTLGGSAPGPSTYWVDVVARVSPAEIDALRASTEPGDVTPPPLAPHVASALPSGPFVGGAALDRVFAIDDGTASAVIDVAARTVVVSAVFEELPCAQLTQGIAPDGSGCCESV